MTSSALVLRRSLALALVLACSCGGATLEAPTDGEREPASPAASAPAGNGSSTTPGTGGTTNVGPAGGEAGGDGDAPGRGTDGSRGSSPAPACTATSPTLDDSVAADTVWTGPIALLNAPPSDAADPDPGGAGYPIAPVSAVTADATYVYWTFNDPSSQKGAILKAPIAGGAPVTLAAPTAKISFASQLAVDATTLYFIDDFGSLAKVPLDGSGPLTFVDVGENWAAESFALDGDQIYFTAVSPQGGETLLLMRVPKAGGQPTQVAASHTGGSPTGGGVALDATNIYWESLSSSTSYVVIGCGGGCETTEVIAEVLSVPREGGTVTTLATTPPSLQQGGTTSLAVDADNVYFVSHGSLVSVPIGGGSVTTIASSPWVPDDFAFDGTSFYWGAVSCTGALVAKVAKTGGPVSSVLEVDHAQAVSTAVSGSDVFSLYGVIKGAWSGVATGSLAHIAPK